MTVQELIDELLQVEDRAKEIRTFDQDYGDWLESGGIDDFGDFIGIH